jgi:hypothetical protein
MNTEVNWALMIFGFFNVASCWLSGIDGLAGILGKNAYMAITEASVKTDIKINGARHPKALPMTSPRGTPNTKDPLTPMNIVPIALARNSSFTMEEAMVMDRTMIREPLEADIIRPNIKIQ